MAKLINRIPRTGRRSSAASMRTHPQKLRHYAAPESSVVVASSRLHHQYLLINGIRSAIVRSKPQPLHWEPIHAGRLVEFEASVLGEELPPQDMLTLNEYRKHEPVYVSRPCIHSNLSEVTQASLNDRLTALGEMYGLSSSKTSLHAASLKALKSTEDS